MKWVFFIFLFLAQNSQANIYVRSPNLDPIHFKEIVLDKQGQSLSSWLVTKDLGQTRTEKLLDLGERFLRKEIHLTQFLTSVNVLTDIEVPTAEWRQALVDILLKKNENAQKETPELWHHICYFYHLDESIQERWPQFHQRCHHGISKISATKPDFLKNDLVYVDGIEWKDKIIFSKGSVPRAWAMQIRIYSDADAPVQLKVSDLNLISFSRTPLVQGHCPQFQFSPESLLKYDLPLLKVYVIANHNCIQPVMSTPALEGTNRWERNKKWFWLAGIIVGGLLINELKEKEIVFELP